MNILQFQKSSQSPHYNTQNYICHGSQDHTSEIGREAKKREKVKANSNTTIISQHYLNRQQAWEQRINCSYYNKFSQYSSAKPCSRY